MPVRVLLPIPGEPPSSTNEPGTRPPPNTRSNSPIPVRIRCSAGASTSRSGIGLGADTEPPRLELPEFFRASTSEFHSPQPGQRPVQVSDTWPHCWQM
jgi:hypothetical protein